MYDVIPFANLSVGDRVSVSKTVTEADGALYIADYGEQRSRLMRWLSRLTIQQLDGVHDTQPNADGLLPFLMREAGFDDIRELENFRTPTGAIGILHARKRLA